MRSPPGADTPRAGPRAGLRAGLVTLAALLLACAPAPPGELALLAEPGPWPWVSRMVGYRGRLWFVNSERGGQHATADVLSYDPARGAVRYEGHLFSQEAGWPAVVGGLLFWPHEDSRYHLGLAHVSVTDGERFALRAVPAPHLGHLHALAPWRGGLAASASLVRPVLLTSADLGGSWQVLHAAPEGRRRIARILRIEPLGERLFGALFDGIQVEQRRTLVEIGEAGVRTVPGWPEGTVRALAARGARLYGVVEEGEGAGLWSTDGRRSERHAGPPGRLRDLDSAGSELWALTVEAEGGRVWRSADGRDWTLEAESREGRPQELQLLGGRPYLAGQAPGGRGGLWGPAPPAQVGPEGTSPAWPPPAAAETGPPSAQRAAHWDAERAALRRALADPASYAGSPAPLARRVARLAASGPPADLFSGLLGTERPPGTVAILEREVPAARLGDWVLLWGIALAGRGRVPPALLAEPFEGARGSRAKSFQPLLAALAAVAATGQGDAATVEALLGRLRAGADPAWLTGDVVAALTAATGQRLGYDVEAWLAWGERRPRASAPRGLRPRPAPSGPTAASPFQGAPSWGGARPPTATPPASPGRAAPAPG